MLAIQDTSEFTVRTTPERRRGLGEIGKGVGRGVILHAMLALDAGTGACLGLALQLRSLLEVSVSGGGLMGAAP